MKHLEECIQKLMDDKLLENIAVKVGRYDEDICELYRSKNGSINELTLSDMASVSKIVSTTSLALIALDRGLMSLDDSPADFFDFECGEDQKNLKIRNLLTHTITIPNSRINMPGVTQDNVAEFILKEKDIKPGTEFRYSCVSFILLQKIVEKLLGNSQDVLFSELVCKPLGMTHTCYNPQDKSNIVNSNMTDEEIGLVNDFNSRFLGGVAGNAGVFSNMKDMTLFAKGLLKGLPFVSKETFDMATKDYIPHSSMGRGLGYIHVDERFAQTGGLFSNGSIGHCGHTGQSVFADRNTGLYTIILSDATLWTTKKYGVDDYDNIMKMREDLHGAIKKDLGI